MLEVGVTPISMAHKEQISSLCNGLQLPLSEYSFANLYLFRAIQKFHVVTLKEGLAIAGISFKRKPFILPLFHPKDWRSVLDEAKLPIYPIPEMWFDEARQTCAIVTDDGDSDYIYETDSIQKYRGRRFDGHRNAIRRLLDDHEITVHSLGPDTQKRALEVIDAWAREHTKSMQQDDAAVCKEAVLMAQKLQLDGWVFDVDGRPAGLLMGTPLTADMYCVMFKKSFPQVKGLSPYMFQTLALAVDPKFRYLNMEQDLGEEGLRKSKESFRPIRKAKKGRVAAKASASISESPDVGIEPTTN